MKSAMPAPTHCLACGDALPPPKRKATPRLTCDDACRQRLYATRRDARIAAEARAAALAEHGIAA